MPLFWKHYQSDVTQFIDELKAKTHTLEQEQYAGRALLWDKPPIDLDERAQFMKAEVPQPAYVYQTKIS